MITFILHPLLPCAAFLAYILALIQFCFFLLGQVEAICVEPATTPLAKYPILLHLIEFSTVALDNGLAVISAIGQQSYASRLHWFFETKLASQKFIPRPDGAKVCIIVCIEIGIYFFSWLVEHFPTWRLTAFVCTIDMTLIIATFGGTWYHIDAAKAAFIAFMFGVSSLTANFLEGKLTIIGNNGSRIEEQTKRMGKEVTTFFEQTSLIA